MPSIKLFDANEDARQFLAQSLPCTAAKVSQYFSLCSSMTLEETDYPQVSMLDGPPPSDFEMSCTPDRAGLKRESDVLHSPSQVSMSSPLAEPGPPQRNLLY